MRSEEPQGQVSEVELAPEVLNALDAAIELQREAAQGESRITERELSVAEELLLVQAEHDPPSLSRARNPATWAAGALHACFAKLRPWTVPERRMTQEELAARFGVSAGSVSRRSRTLHETARDLHFLPFPDGSPATRILIEVLEHDAARTTGDELRDVISCLLTLLGPDFPDAYPSGPSDAPPDARIEGLLRLARGKESRTAAAEAARLLTEHAEEIEEKALKRLLTAGLEEAARPDRTLLLDLAVRRFGTEVGTWTREGADRWL